MKKSLQVVLFVICLSFKAFSQSIPNGDFENWNTTNYENPMYYWTSNDEVIRNDMQLNVVKTTDAYHGNFAVQLTTVANATDTNFAFIANGDPGHPQGQGIPYNEKPTGLTGYYKSNIMAGDTALIWIIFKSGGNVINSSIFKLNGNNFSYVHFFFPLSLAVTPDSLILAIVPSNPFYSVVTPGSTLTIDSISFTGVNNQPAGLNGDFELWQTNTTYILSGWEIADQNTGIDNDPYAGNFNLRLETITNEDGEARSGYATTGKSTNNGTYGGYPFSNSTDTLSFFYKYYPQGNDSAQLRMEFKSATNWYSKEIWLHAAGSYTNVEVPVQMGFTPDSVILYVNSSYSWNPANSTVGTTLKIDDIYFKSQLPTGSFKLTMKKNGWVSPNPFSEMLFVNTGDSKELLVKVELMDVNGKLVLKKNYDHGETNDILNSTDIENGTYLLTIRTDKSVYHKKIVRAY